MRRPSLSFIHRLLRPRMSVLRWDLPSWGFFFSLSVGLALIATIPLMGMAQITRIPFFIAMICGISGMVVLALLTKVITGTEVYNFHHYLLVVLSVAAVTLWLMGEPVLRNLDVVVIAVGVTYACGRFACLRSEERRVGKEGSGGWGPGEDRIEK